MPLCLILIQRNVHGLSFWKYNIAMPTNLHKVVSDFLHGGLEVDALEPCFHFSQRNRRLLLAEVHPILFNPAVKYVARGVQLWRPTSSVVHQATLMHTRHMCSVNVLSHTSRISRFCCIPPKNIMLCLLNVRSSITSWHMNSLHLELNSTCCKVLRTVQARKSSRLLATRQSCRNLNSVPYRMTNAYLDLSLMPRKSLHRCAPSPMRISEILFQSDRHTSSDLVAIYDGWFTVPNSCSIDVPQTWRWLLSTGTHSWLIYSHNTRTYRPMSINDVFFPAWYSIWKVWSSTLKLASVKRFT